MSAHLREPKRRKSAFRVLYAILVALSAVIVAAFIVYKLTVKPPPVEQPSSAPVQTSQDPETTPTPTPEPRVRREDFYTFLVFGIDDGNGNTDTILVGSYDVANQRISAVSIPRDTLIDTDRTNKRINAVWAYEKEEGLEGEIAAMLGIPIDFYVRVNLRAFVEIVDALGGVDFDVPVDLDYDDPTQDLSIHFKAGMQHLDGADALKVARCRNAYASQDIGRVQTQQLLLKALAAKALKIGNIAKVKEFANIFSKYVKTDLSLANIVWFGEQFLSFDMANLSLSTIPFNSANSRYDGRYYVTLDIEKVAAYVDGHLNPYTTPITEQDLEILTVIDGEAVHSDDLYPR